MSDMQAKLADLEARQQAIWDRIGELNKQRDELEKERQGVVLDYFFTDLRLKDTVWDWEGGSTLTSRWSQDGFADLMRTLKPDYHDRFHMPTCRLNLDADDGTVRLHFIGNRGPRWSGEDDLIEVCRKYGLKVTVKELDRKYKEACDTIAHRDKVVKALSEAGILA